MKPTGTLPTDRHLTLWCPLRAGRTGGVSLATVWRLLTGASHVTTGGTHSPISRARPAPHCSQAPHITFVVTLLSPLLIIIPPPPPPPPSLRGDQHHHHLLQAATRNRYRQTMYKRVRKSIKAERIYTLIHGLHPTIETRALIWKIIYGNRKSSLGV